MPPLLTSLLLVIFLIHLVAFAVLGLRRRQVYYMALVVTFSLLSAAMAARLTIPDTHLGDGVALDEALRMAALVAAAVSIGWTLVRLRDRIRRKRRID
ncbi:hypothetical protein [Aquisalimonas sp.]|uniref:hypothetical protein n=1 Tax=Aquisalimonas sp. TaxID=1872621 RepID=UPI0025C3867E|nr:hypothetical protein [Aquisalimonas sp.]